MTLAVLALLAALTNCSPLPEEQQSNQAANDLLSVADSNGHENQGLREVRQYYGGHAGGLGGYGGGYGSGYGGYRGGYSGFRGGYGGYGNGFGGGYPGHNNYAGYGSRGYYG